jgi:molecular chaperone Hsp33
MIDTLEHYHLYDYRARAALAITTGITRELQQRHNLDPITTIAIGRAVSCVALLASILKTGEEYYHALFTSEALIKRIAVECNGAGDCRGYVSPERIEQTMQEGDEVPDDVAEALGRRGMLIVTRGKYGSEPYRAMSEFDHGGIATDFARYLTDSEQIPSAVAAGVKLSKDGEVLGAGAVLFQKLAGTNLDEAALQRVEERMTSQLKLSERIASGEPTAEIIKMLQGDEGGYGMLLQRPLQFKCTCSRQKMASALYALGEDEIEAIKQDTGKLEVRCHYCATVHNFDVKELTRH